MCGKWEVSIVSFKFFCKSKAIIKLKVYLNKESIGRIQLRGE